VLDRLCALALAGTVAPLVLLLLAVGYGRTSYLDVALVLAAMSLTGSLVFARLVVRR
jgi:multisubunit Na+/H+ antiporter MnhF subunit